MSRGKILLEKLAKEQSAVEDPLDWLLDYPATIHSAKMKLRLTKRRTTGCADPLLIVNAEENAKGETVRKNIVRKTTGKHHEICLIRIRLSTCGRGTILRTQLVRPAFKALACRYNILYLKGL